MVLVISRCVECVYIGSLLRLSILCRVDIIRGDDAKLLIFFCSRSTSSIFALAPRTRLCAYNRSESIPRRGESGQSRAHWNIIFVISARIKRRLSRTNSDAPEQRVSELVSLSDAQGEKCLATINLSELDSALTHNRPTQSYSTHRSGISLFP